MDSEFEGSKYFLMIPTLVSRDPELLKKPKSVILFGEIYTMLNATGKFYMSNSLLCKRLDCKQTALKGYLSLLEDRGYIRRQIVYGEDSKQVVGRYITLGPALGRASDEGSAEATAGGGSQEQPSPSHADDHKDISIRDQKNISVKDTGQAKSLPEEKIPYKKILDYLNQKTGKHYRSNAKANRDLIKARWNDGFRFDDFKKVIDNKVSEWLGTGFTFSSGQLAENYLRPETLFSGKFDRYLNETVNNAANNVPDEYQGLFDQQPEYNAETGDLPF